MKYSPIRNKVNASQVAKELRENAPGLVAEAEKAYREKLIHVSETAMRDHKHIILVTGPSASGKTTSAKRIASILEENGKKVNRISLDNFYKSRDKLPRWEDGYQNYESVEGLDMVCFDQILSRLLTKGEAVFPVFNFSEGTRSDKTFTLYYDEQTYLIIEGIHALNPVLLNVLEEYPAIKVYISVHSDIVNDKGHILLGARDLRLSRRILRDFHCRSTAAEGTLKMWKYVLKGEKLYIFPFRDNADIHIDSTHMYEPFLYHDGLEEMMGSIEENSPYFPEAQRLLQASQEFFAIPESLIPQTSLIQEFLEKNMLEESRIKVRDV